MDSIEVTDIIIDELLTYLLEVLFDETFFSVGSPPFLYRLARKITDLFNLQCEYQNSMRDYSLKPKKNSMYMINVESINEQQHEKTNYYLAIIGETNVRIYGLYSRTYRWRSKLSTITEIIVDRSWTFSYDEYTQNLFVIDPLSEGFIVKCNYLRQIASLKN